MGSARALVSAFLVLGMFMAGFGRDMSSDAYAGMRKAMVKKLIRYGIKDRRILSAMGKIRRHLFIPENYRDLCNPYGNHPCPIGYGQTISQPFMVAYMTERLKLKPGEKVLEIGTGSGYQAAVLAETGVSVTSMEIVKELVTHSRQVLTQEGYGDVTVVHASGFEGYSLNAPYDAVLVTCAPTDVPPALIGQLKDGGRMILPLGKYSQKLLFLRKKGEKVSVSREMDVRFVPMVEQNDPE